MSNTRSTPPGLRPINTAELIDRLKQRVAGAPPAASPSATEPPIIAHAGVVMTGRLIRHGMANYAFRSGTSPSYYIELATAQGSKVLWGVDLRRAMAESQTQPKVGELIGVQRTGYQIFAPSRARPAAQLEAKAREPLRRTRWRVEHVVFFAHALLKARRERESRLEERQPQRTRPKPEPRSTSMQMASEFVERHIRHPEDRTRFLSKVEAAFKASTDALRDSGDANTTVSADRREPDRDPPVP